MSSCLILQKKDVVFMGADSALCSVVGGEFYRVSENQKKIYQFENGIIFCSGDMVFVEKMIGFIKKTNSLVVEDISIFLKNIKFPNTEKIFNIEIVACIVENGAIKVYQISEYNNFDIIEHKSPEQREVRVLSCGINTEKCSNLATEALLTTNKVSEIYKNVFNGLSCEQVGGTLEVWKIENGMSVVFSDKIIEKNIKHLSTHSIVADVIVGRLVASNELLVTNETSTFNVSGSRASFVNAEVTLYNENNTSQILLNPYTGIAISKKNDFGDFEKKFYTDTDGNVIFSGSLSAASGTFEGEITAKLGKIGAWKIDDLGLYDDYNNYIYGDGRVRLGMLTIEGSTATFNGNIYAANLVDQVQAYQIETVAAESILAGTIFGVKIYGGEILWPGVRMYSPHAGFSFIECSSFLGLVSEDNIIDITPEYIQLFSDKEIFIGRDAYSTNIILRAGLLSINGQIGVSGIFVI